ncbi:MAG: hypothetical protein JJU21_02840 [Salinarimonas sp.]|nr:hypothetical protein [Salinarimonas sp.]
MTIQFHMIYGRPAIYRTGPGGEVCLAWNRARARFEDDPEALADLLGGGSDTHRVDAPGIRLGIARMLARHEGTLPELAADLDRVITLDNDAIRNRRRLSPEEVAARQEAAERAVRTKAANDDFGLSPELLREIL